MPDSYDLKVYRGDTKRWQFTLYADADKTEPADLTGVTVKSEIRDKSGGTQITNLPCTINNNTITAMLNAGASKKLKTGGYWDMQLTYTSGDVVTAVAGKVTVVDDITDSTP